MLTKEQKEFIIKLLLDLYVDDKPLYYFKSDEKMSREIIKELSKDLQIKK